jgi:hypothetical protein
MTIEEFLEELAATPGPWRVSFHAIRVRRECESWVSDCPISAVARKHGWDAHAAFADPVGAGKNLGLSHEDAKAIRLAADTTAGNFSLRRDLLSACNLIGKVA